MEDIARTTQKITAQAIQYVRAEGFPESRRVYSRWDDGIVTVEFDNDPFRRYLVKEPPVDLDWRETAKIRPASVSGSPAPFDLLTHLHKAITDALMSAPPDASATDSELALTIISIGLAGIPRERRAAVLLSALPGVEAIEARAVAQLRAIYQKNRSIN